MVPEQDFIMAVRRLHRSESAVLVANIILTAAESVRGRPALLEQLQAQLISEAARLGGQATIMSSGDAFVTFPLGGGKNPLPELIEGVLPRVVRGEGEDTARWLQLYQLPRDYLPLRERLNHYLEAARARDTFGGARNAELVLQSEQVRGPLTAFSLSQVEKVIADASIARHVRTQACYREVHGRWQMASEEYYISLTDLKRERFPRLNIETPERLFLELCSLLDTRLLAEMAERVDSWRGRAVSMNLAIETVLSGDFARFCHALGPGAHRQKVAFELNRGELLLNMANTRNAIAALRREGFLVTLDGLVPELLPMFDPLYLQPDFLKIRVARHKLDAADQQAFEAALAALPAERIIFYHCDNEPALALGRRLGVHLFQGWLIDDLSEQNR